ncbi:MULTISPECIES: helix-turn-helix domain-containing protein [Clostridia]|uniref:XRE family transcriptional regulator n=1 Tax=Lacrimispora celerecrescens TaxID=29354 RepID=A0A084JS51_9FIRM|nr:MULTISPECIES: helix-turn-helix domain-containing protein [Clostridia]KEZ91785.1 XRE family transcriptional regulator [Lacrimispora celerecrescens]MBW4848300.1 helix-turn-helix domain-containing protein [Lachnospiraceae bacterium]MSS09143.1 helix-turn-helix domain-containing protein [Clostridium sp. WB02_MRS01]HBG13679.1 helix-turn-helix domain-containing protein [Clostridium sp.]
METSRVGSIIRTLRQELRMTQRELADKMNLSDKTISKWERGLGLPDISLIPELSRILGIEIMNLLAGDMTPNNFAGGNMKNTKYFVCPTCQNITLCTGEAEVSCCGKKLAAQTLKKAEEGERLTVHLAEDDWYITSEHPMDKEHYISFVALASGDRLQIIKQYPEWNLNVRIPKRERGMLIWYSTDYGLRYQLLNKRS